MMPKTPSWNNFEQRSNTKQGQEVGLLAGLALCLHKPLQSDF